MLLTTALIGLSRKINDDRAKKKEKRDALLQSSASASPTSPSSQDMIEQDTKTNPPGGIYVDVRNGSIRENVYRHSSSVGSVPVQMCSSHGSLEGNRLQVSPTQSTKVSTEGTQGKSSFAIQTDGAKSVGPVTSGVRVRTKGADLRSGFPYDPELFDFGVRPGQWESFTTQILEATKFGGKDYAQMWAAATATALAGAVFTSAYVGRSINYSIQEKKASAGLQDIRSGALGRVLLEWNEGAWRDLDLFVHLELSQSAQKRASQRSVSLRKPASLYSRREDRERKREERKFSIVVTRINGDGMPEDAIHELAEKQDTIAELPCTTMADVVPELPGEEAKEAAELPANDWQAWLGDKYFQHPPDHALVELEDKQLAELEDVGCWDSLQRPGRKSMRKS